MDPNTMISPPGELDPSRALRLVRLDMSTTKPYLKDMLTAGKVKIFIELLVAFIQVNGWFAW